MKIGKEQFYSLPLEVDSNSYWVYDADGNFIFQFDTGLDCPILYKILDKFSVLVVEVLNGNQQNPIKDVIKEEDGVKIGVRTIGTTVQEKIYFKITIRGWGNLTGTGANNFTPEKAAVIQDDLRDWIYDKLKNA